MYNTGMDYFFVLIVNYKTKRLQLSFSFLDNQDCAIIHILLNLFTNKPNYLQPNDKNVHTY